MDSVYSYETIEQNLKEITANINEAYDKYRNDGSEVRIMAVTKTVPPEAVNSAVKMGIDLLGENRVQEYLSKKDFYDKSAEVHFIGHLQTNKVKYIINEMTLIQSVDSLRLAEEIDRLSKANNKIMNVLIEVNIGGEESKSGVSPENLRELISGVSALENVRIKGLMTIPPPSESDVFLGRMQELFNKFKSENISGADMEILSMGMTHDYKQAVKYGSTLVRIGTGLFGARNYR